MKLSDIYRDTWNMEKPVKNMLRMIPLRNVKLFPLESELLLSLNGEDLYWVTVRSIDNVQVTFQTFPSSDPYINLQILIRRWEDYGIYWNIQLRVK